MSRKKLEHALCRAVEDLPRPGLDAVSGPPVVRMEKWGLTDSSTVE